jgi:hypothetical protein
VVTVPRWLRNGLIAVAVIVALYILGFVLFGIGDESPGPASLRAARSHDAP